MSKYYKADDVINAIEDKIAEYIPVLYGRYCEMPLEIRMAIESMPTIDIVHCKDCRLSKVYPADSRRLECRVCVAYTHIRLVADDDYCSDGERIDNE